MTFVVQPESPPLHEDPTGAIRVGSSRILLELIIHAFQDGATPETILQRYPTLTLPDIYAVIAYYLRHHDEAEQYLAHREELATKNRQRPEHSHSDLTDIRVRLLAHRNHE